MAPLLKRHLCIYLRLSASSLQCHMYSSAAHSSQLFHTILQPCMGVGNGGYAGDLTLLFFFFYSILCWSVAVSTMRRQSSRIAAFLQADARPMFCWPRSASTARSQVWLGLPSGRFQSGGSPWITAATARWWSSCGELRAICPKSSNVCQCQ